MMAHTGRAAFVACLIGILSLFAGLSLFGAELGALARDQVRATLTAHLPLGLSPFGVAADAHGSVYVTCPTEGLLLRFDPVTGEVTGSLDFGVLACDLAYDSARNLLLMTNSDDGILRAIGLPELVVTRQTPVGQALAEVYVDQANDQYYLCDLGAKKLLVVDPASWEVIRNADLSEPPFSIARFADSDLYAVGCVTQGGGEGRTELPATKQEATVELVDMATLERRGTIRFPGKNIADLAYCDATASMLVVVGHPEAVHQLILVDDVPRTELLAEDFAGSREVGNAYGISVHGERAYVSTRHFIRHPERVIEINLRNREWRPILNLGLGMMCVCRGRDGRQRLAIPGADTGTVSFLQLD